MEEKRRSYAGTDLVLPLFAAVCAICAFLLLFSSGPGVRLSIWNFRTGFAMMKGAAYIGFGCAILAVASSVVSVRRRHFKGILISLLALIVALFTLYFPVYWTVQAKSYPRIHDISTDLSNPPHFVAISSARGSAVRYGGIDIATQQLKAYPDLKTVVLPIPAGEAYKKALLIARELKWKVVAELPAEGIIEATDTTRWFGFKDDIAIRIVPAGERSLLDVRSVSRVGISDVGTNAKRIRTFLAKMGPGRT